MKNCQHCNRGEVTRVPRTTLEDFAYSMVGLYPYICKNCNFKCFRSRAKQVAVSVCYGLFVLGILGFSVSYTRSKRSVRRPPTAAAVKASLVKAGAHAVTVRADLNILTNQDVMELSKAGMSERSITRLVRTMPRRFDIDTESLVRLKRAGVSEDVILAVVECALANSGKEMEQAVPAVLLGMNP
jgi:hypothetical protein